ncbi:MAG: nickel pincer cofactor biosynthesis protein LarB [Hyphomicrobiaceae bacterium]
MSASEFNHDHDRTQRLGFAEAIFCQDKSPAQIASILRSAKDAGNPLLLTRLSPDKSADIVSVEQLELDYDDVSQTAYFLRQPQSSRSGLSVAIVTAGTSDAAPAREAYRTLLFHDVEAELYFDVGVAGLWRLLDRLDEIRRHDVVIVVAGMDAALPSVLGGLVHQPIIAVPTSTGYGAARSGETALAACLTSCAPGVLVCNIDNGYGAACAALRILNIR